MTKINRQKKRIINVISRLIGSCWAIISIILFIMLILINILPAKYMTIIVGFYAPFLIVMLLLLWWRKVKIGIKIAINIIGLIIMVAFSFGIFYMYKTMNFMELIQSKDYQIEEYYVMTLKNSNYTKINDIRDEEIGVLPLDNDNYDKALTKLDELVTVDKKEYQDFLTMSQDLLDGKIKVMFISLVHKSIIEDMKPDFATKTKIIETISLKVSNEVETKEVNISKEAFNIYISGIDIFGDISLVSRSDVNMIMTVNPNTHQILLTSIPRDYYVRLHDTTGYKDKLTHAGIYGVDMSVKTIEDLLDININYYARVNFTTLISLVDAIDGIDVYSDKSFVTQNGTTFKKGMNHLNGDKALSFARERHAFKDGDRQRVKNQQAVITAIIDKIMSSRTLVTKYTSILETLGKSFQTNIDTSKIYELVNMQLDKMPNWEIDSISLNGTDSSNYTYSYQLQKLYVMEPDMDTVYAARDQINAITNANE